MLVLLLLLPQSPPPPGEFDSVLMPSRDSVCFGEDAAEAWDNELIDFPWAAKELQFCIRTWVGSPETLFQGLSRRDKTLPLPPPPPPGGVAVCVALNKLAVSRGKLKDPVCVDGRGGCNATEVWGAPVTGPDAASKRT